MCNFKIVIGANFGDEGKGLMTDYFVSNAIKSKQDVLNVRFNGTAQAGHTVVKGDKRHVFQHFGSGILNSNANNRVTTYLPSYFYINPIFFSSEYRQLVQNFGIIPYTAASRKCPVVTVFDMLYNRTIETFRGNNRHGSCGLGLWESLLRGRAGEHLYLQDIESCTDSELRKKIINLRDGYYANKFMRDGIEDITLTRKASDGVDWFDDSLVDAYIRDCRFMMSKIRLMECPDIFNFYNNGTIVFEGAQGLLLDWMNREYMPYLTASRTGLHNVVNLIDISSVTHPEIEVCYVTRSYFTKHGAGQFNTEVPDKSMLGNLGTDKTNHQNPWQGYFRYGYFDLSLFKQALKRDLFELYQYGYKKSIAITHLNETSELIKTDSTGISLSDFMNEMVGIGPPNDGGQMNGWSFYGSYTDDSLDNKNYLRSIC